MRKLALIILITLAITLLSAACRADNSGVPEDESNSIATQVPLPPLHPADQIDPTAEQGRLPDAALVEQLRGLWNRIDGSTATIPLTTAIYELLGEGRSPPRHNTTSQAYLNLIIGHNGTYDLIFVTHPSEEELEVAREQGVELEIIPIVKDALVFLVNIDNPVENITFSQLREIYSGTITNWSALGGLDEQIIAYQRPGNSGSQTLMLKLLMDGNEPAPPPTQWVVGSMDALVETISAFDNSRHALGYSMFYFVNNMFGNSRFRLLGVDGIVPTRDTIMRGQYPLESHYYAVIRKDTPDDHPARALIEWLLSDEGQILAASAGYIPLRAVEGAWNENGIDPVYLGDTENSSGTGGTEIKTDIADVLHTGGVRPRLSDLFFDGFNYIQYLNSEIFRQINMETYDYYFQYTWGDIHQIRPFTGIPNDYPHFEIDSIGNLFIYFPENNPFFSGSEISIYISLSQDVSPYGHELPIFFRNYEYMGQLLPGVRLLATDIVFTEPSESTASINQQLRVWFDSFFTDEDALELLESFSQWYNWNYILQPTVAIWRDYLSVSYILNLYDGPSMNMPMLRTISFDISTGAVVALADVLPDNLDFSDAHIFTRADFNDLDDWGWLNQEFMPDEYIPVEGSIITDAWIMYDRINVYLIEPDGRLLQVYFWEYLS